MKLSCLAGVRYLSVQDPRDVVVAECDQFTNLWRQYPRTLVDVEHTTELTNEGAAVAAWCTCGWSRFAFHGPAPADATVGAARAAEMARAHELDPGAN